MGLISNLLRLFSFLSSFVGTVLFSACFYFFLGPFFAYSLLIGLSIITFFVFMTNTGLRKRLAFRSFARQKGMTRSHAKLFSKSVQNRLLSGHIARAFLIGFIAIYYNQLLMVFATIFCALVILSTMRSRHATLLKVILSAILGSATGVIGVILSNFWF